MNLKIKHITVALILNFICSILMAIININLGLIVMIIGMIVVPLLINTFSFIVGQGNRSILNVFIMSIFNLIYYIITSNSVMHNTKFKEVLAKYSYEKGDFFIHLNANLTALSQLIFIFLFYFVISFLIMKLFRKSVHA
ncbi:Msa family membrane protein [Staphylococcus sp. EZ-P03]|uniref:Msa family membrane protein n=1 Tax=Staphylococcus sp. EZ-P03 TaxID=2282739 RepID=UPI000DF80ADA|nr:Msa family membrane protein [Staphylococcus sp. EZ-P03]